MIPEQKKAFSLLQLVKGGLGDGVEIDLTPEIEPVSLNPEFPQMEFPTEKPIEKVSLTPQGQAETKTVKSTKAETVETDETEETEKTALSASKGAKAGVLVLDMINSTIASIVGKKPRMEYKWERGEKKELEDALKIYIESSDFQVSPGWALFLVLATMVAGTMSEAYQDGQEAKGRKMRKTETEPETETPKPNYQPRQPQTRILQQPETEKKSFSMASTKGEKTQEQVENSFMKLKKKSGTRPRIKDVFEDLGGDISMTTVAKYIKEL